MQTENQIELYPFVKCESDSAKNNAQSWSCLDTVQLASQAAPAPAPMLSLCSYVAPCLAYDFKNCPFWGFDLHSQPDPARGRERTGGGEQRSSGNEAAAMTSYLGAKRRAAPAVNRDCKSCLALTGSQTKMAEVSCRSLALVPRAQFRWIQLLLLLRLFRQCRSSHINCTIRKQQ